MIVLTDILQGIPIKKIIGDINRVPTLIDIDSRKMKDDAAFIAIKGTVNDGHDFIEQAVKNGAKIIICEFLPKKISQTVSYVQIKDTALYCGKILSNFYGNPSAKINVVGVTGTNGKTTTATLLYKLFMQLGHKSGLLSTVKNCINKKEYPSTHTTPDPISLFAMLDEMVKCGCEYCFMEVSSHAIHQNRVSGIDFKGMIFTNITHDHLDYHKTFDEYLIVKKSAFDKLSKSAFALSNVDDKNGKVILQNTKASKNTYSLKSVSDFKCRIIESSMSGMILNIDGVEVSTPFIGEFNAYNLLGVYSAAILLAKQKNEVLLALSSLSSVDGRFECFRSKNNVTVIVDYAHTPDALLNVLNTINKIKKPKEKIITVVGAGGDRDKTKRPIMGKISSELSDKLIITSDNPRSENSVSIADEIRAGIDEDRQKSAITIIDRKEAIRTALIIASKGDIILVAGKGHENYQEIMGKRYHFDDREVVKELINM